MPFRFSLQEVLEHRERIEEIRQREVAEAARRADYVQQVLGEADRRRQQNRRELGEAVQAGQPFAVHELYTNYLSSLQVLITLTERQLEELENDLTRRREQLAEAARQREVMERLRDTERREYELEERRAENREYDDIALREYARRQREKTAGTMEGAAS